MKPIGKRRWAIAEGYIPGDVRPKTRALASHETACLLNAADEDVTLFFSDREPAGPHRVAVPAQRTLHLRFNDLGVPPETDYSSVIESDVPIVVQHTRLDSRDAQLALLSTTAYASRLTKEGS